MIENFNEHKNSSKQSSNLKNLDLSRDIISEKN